MQCHDCGVERERLHRHHIIPKALGGSDDPENLINICPNCHDDRHYGGAHGQLNSHKSQSPEANALRSAAMRARWADPEYRERVIAGRERSALYQHDRRVKIGHTLRQKGIRPPDGSATTPEVNARRAETHRTLWADPEYREARRVSRSQQKSDGANSKRSETMRRRWAEGAFADRARGPISEAIKKAWADGKYANRAKPAK